MFDSQLQNHGIPPSDESFCQHFFARLLLNAIRGAAATLLMPLDVLDSIRRSTIPNHSQAVSWGLSTAIYAIAGLSVHTFQQISENGLLPLFSMALIVILTILNGRLQPQNPAPLHVHPHFMRHRGRFHHFATVPSPLVSAPATVSNNTPQPICCRDCRNCHNDICVRTGKPRRKSL